MLLSPGTAVVPRRLCKHTCGGTAQPAPAFERNPQCGSRSRRGAERRYPAVLPGGGGPIGGHGSADERRGRLQPHETGHRLPHGEPHPPHACLAGPHGTHALLSVDGNISLDNARRARRGGANTFVLGTASIFRPERPLEETCLDFRAQLENEAWKEASQS